MMHEKFCKTCRIFACSYYAQNRVLLVQKISSSAESLISVVTKPPVLMYSDFAKAFMMDMDTSSLVVGAIFAQKYEAGKVHQVSTLAVQYILLRKVFNIFKKNHWQSSLL